MADLKLTGVEKTYGGSVRVLHDIDLDIKTGELIVFVGPLWLRKIHAAPDDRGAGKDLGRHA